VEDLVSDWMVEAGTKGECFVVFICGLSILARVVEFSGCFTVFDEFFLTHFILLVC